MEGDREVLGSMASIGKDTGKGRRREVKHMGMNLGVDDETGSKQRHGHEQRARLKYLTWAGERTRTGRAGHGNRKRTSVVIPWSLSFSN